MSDPSKLITAEVEERMLQVGVDFSAHPTERAGSFMHLDEVSVHAEAKAEGLEVLAIREALETHGWLRELYGSLVAADKDEYTRRAEEELHGGYFIRALPGARITAPVQACMYIMHEGLVQCVHNVIIAEEGSFLPVITGCAAHFGSRSGTHIGVSEFFVRRGATLRFSMIHAWGEDVKVRPRSAGVVEEDGAFLNDYVSLEQVRDLQMYPATRLVGAGATARFRSVVAAPTGSLLDLGSAIYLDAPRARGEILSRNVSTGGRLIARGLIEAHAPDVQGHLECRGLLLSQEGSIAAIPELNAAHPEVELSHEAAVGRIGEQEIMYLMARGLTQDEAVAAIVHGFLDLGIEGLPPVLDKRIAEIVALSDSGAMERR